MATRLGQEFMSISLCKRQSPFTEDVYKGVKHLLPEPMRLAYAKASWDERQTILYADIFDYLDSIAPEGYFFGHNPDEDYNFGFWERGQAE